MTESMTHAAAYWADIWRKRYFWMSLVKVDLRTRYRRSWLGIGWSLMHPIAMTAVFCLVFCRLFDQNPLTYAPYVLSGLAFWNYITGVMTEGCQCFFVGERYIRQHPAPMAIYPLRTTMGMAIHLLMAIAVLLGLVWTTQGFGNLAALWALVPAMAIVFIMGWSVAFCVGVANVIFQDTQQIVQVGMQALFYATPIFYPADLLESRGLSWLVTYNPLAKCVDLIRQPILGGTVPSPADFGVGLAAALVCAASAALVQRWFERRLIYYL